MYIRIVGGQYEERSAGRIYAVVAIYFGIDVEAMIDVEWFPSAPMAVPERHFQLIDERISRHWRYGPAIPGSKSGNSRPTILSFPEWVHDQGFFERLVMGDTEARTIWEWRKSQIALEFAHPSISSKSIDLGNGWTQCFDCGHAWSHIEPDEMVICEKCSTLQLLHR